jgi:Lon protease-like protein
MPTAASLAVLLGAASAGLVSQPVSVVPRRVHAHTRASPKLLALPSGGDLQQGRDPERNAILQSLRRSFFESSASEEGEAPAAADDAQRVGMHLDMPLCRWGFHILPHQRTVLNVFQPQYTLLFEKLLAGPQPWLYGHVFLEGGVENLNNPDYRLEPGTRAALTGTIMQVVAVQREEDSRLTLLVQGVGRGVAMRSTQTLPYARADMQLLPDDEQLLACARHGRRFLSGQQLESRSDSHGMLGMQRRVIMAAAAAEEAHWLQYEHANISLSMHQTLAQVVAPMPSIAADGEAAAIADAMRSAPMAVGLMRQLNPRPFTACSPQARVVQPLSHTS